jgi:putative oxidoreductase
MTIPLPRSWSPYLLSVLRIVAGFLFIVHGTQKLYGYPEGLPGGPVELMTRAGVAGVIETVGGALLMMGLLTRLAAFIVAGEMAFAYFLVHAPKGFWPLLNAGELSALYCFLFLYFAAAGGGPISVDAMIARLRREDRAHRGHIGDHAFPRRA